VSRYKLHIISIIFWEGTFISHYFPEFISDKFIEGFVIVQESN
jgi:hypothetical protein